VIDISGTNPPGVDGVEVRRLFRSGTEECDPATMVILLRAVEA
jgi:hypothetical protein